MPRYFFHLHEGALVVDDEEGMLLPDLQSAMVKAIHFARNLIGAEAEKGEVCLAHAIEIENADTGERTIVPFRDTVNVSGL